MVTLVRWIVRLFVFLLAAAAIAYPIADLMREPLDDAARAELTKSGKAEQFVSLSGGVMHVRVQGPEDGPVVLLVHGAATGGFVFRRWIKPLADAGFRVIVPDLLGFGYSDRPTVTHDQAFFTNQLGELLTELNVAAPVHIVGTSLGGAITSDFVAANTARIHSVTLIAPAGLGPVPAASSPTVRLLLLPVVGDWLARVLGPTAAVRGVVEQMKAGAVEGFVDWMGEQTKYRGYSEGQLNTYRHYDLQNRLASYDAIGRSALPVLAVWGTADTTVPFAHSAELVKRVPQMKLVPVEGEEHGLPMRKPDEMVAIVLPFLQAQSGREGGAAAGP
ncbi:MAG: alpha/beta hydrolase [Alphaproteobacteria bacterium]|nr:alpha/beta hydrolase [Alphaproteobacteria bacterium]